MFCGQKKNIAIYRGKCRQIWDVDCGGSKVLLWTLTLSSGAQTYPKVSLLQCSGFIPAVRQWKPPFLLVSPFHPACLRALGVLLARWQNDRNVESYERLIDKKQGPIARGLYFF